MKVEYYQCDGCAKKADFEALAHVEVESFIHERHERRKIARYHFCYGCLPISLTKAETASWLKELFKKLQR